MLNFQKTHLGQKTHTLKSRVTPHIFVSKKVKSKLQLLENFPKKFWAMVKIINCLLMKRIWGTQTRFIFFT